MSHQRHQLEPSTELQIQLALNALEQYATLSERHAAAIYSVPRTELLLVSSVSPESSGLTELTL